MSTTVVRFRKDAQPHRLDPREHHGWPDRPTEGMDLVEIAIELPSRAVPSGPCENGGEWQWRVPDAEVERLTGRVPVLPIYVCQCQVDVD